MFEKFKVNNYLEFSKLGFQAVNVDNKKIINFLILGYKKISKLYYIILLIQKLLKIRYLIYYK